MIKNFSNNFLRPHFINPNTTIWIRQNSFNRLSNRVPSRFLGLEKYIFFVLLKQLNRKKLFFIIIAANQDIKKWASRFYTLRKFNQQQR